MDESPLFKATRIRFTNTLPRFDNCIFWQLQREDSPKRYSVNIFYFFIRS